MYENPGTGFTEIKVTHKETITEPVIISEQCQKNDNNQVNKLLSISVNIIQLIYINENLLKFLHIPISSMIKYL